MIQWFEFVWPTIQFLVQTQFYFVPVLLLVYGGLFGFYYEPIWDDPWEKYGFPGLLTLMLAVITMPLLALVIIAAPFMLGLGVFAGIGFGAVYAGRLYKEGSAS